MSFKNKLRDSVFGTTYLVPIDLIVSCERDNLPIDTLKISCAKIFSPTVKSPILVKSTELVVYYQCCVLTG